MFTLIALGTGTAFAFSAVATMFPGLVPESFHEHGGRVPVYFEAAAVITALVLLGQFLELRARSATSGAIKALLRLAPAIARRLRPDGPDEDVPLDHVQVGDRLRVRPGEKVPVDGRRARRTQRRRRVAAHRRAAPGGEVGGRQGGRRDAERHGVVRDAGGAGRIRDAPRAHRSWVSEAQRSRAPIQRLADRASAWFVPFVIVVAVIAAVVWGLFGPEPRAAYTLVIIASTAMSLSSVSAIMNALRLRR